MTRFLSVSVAAALLLCLAACAPHSPPRRSAALPQPVAGSPAVAQFSAPGDKQGRPTAEVMQQAAALALARGYGYFLLSAAEPNAAAEPQNPAAARPSFGISYGRNPYGFGDASNSAPSGGFGFSLSPSLFRSPAKTEQAWTIYMLRKPDKPALDSLTAAQALPGKIAYIYDARAVARQSGAEPITLPLR